MKYPRAFAGLIPVLAALVWATFPTPTTAAGLRAGTAKVDISPTQYPVIVNAMFTERSATRIVDPLMVRALVLENGDTRIALAVVDTCMMPRELLDAAKAQAAKATGIPASQMLISATHSHSAPSAMGCLGSRVDPRYAAQLPALIAQAIAAAAQQLEPALAGATAFDASGFTHNRRWIRRSDRIDLDPFGERTVRAHMHPGHVSPDVVGPSGPVDPAFTLLSLIRPDGSPIAVFGNFSMHYYESDLLSSDYFGRWCQQLESALATEHGRPQGVRAHPATTNGTPSRPVLALLSQGTSGDLMWMDYSQPRNFIGYDAYAKALSAKTLTAWRTIEHRANAPLGIRETHLPLAYRVADNARLERSQTLATQLGDRLPQTLPEIYALEQLELKRRGRTELVLQALRIGDLAIAALPNEVYALTGLKLKGQSPWPLTMNVELANGAEGYIPPPEQHPLGGYTTWAARTAGLETNAEPRIVETTLQLLEELAGRPRRTVNDPDSTWSHALRATRPTAYWRLDEQSVGSLRNQIPNSRSTAQLEGRYALYLDGADTAAPNRATAIPSTNHAVHLVDGSIQVTAPVAGPVTLSFWLWNGFPNTAAGETGEVLRDHATASATGWRLRIAGTNGPAGCLQLATGTGTHAGHTPLGYRQWHHLAVVTDRTHSIIYLDGKPEIEMTERTEPGAETTRNWRIGGGGTGGTTAPFQGKVDEIACHSRALTAGEIQRLITTLHP